MRFSITSVRHIHPLAISRYHSQSADAALHHYQYFERSCCTLHNFTRGGLTVLSGVENTFLVICAVKTPNHLVPARCHTGGSQRSENNNFDDQDMTDTKTKSSPGALWIHLKLLTFGVCPGTTAFVPLLFCFFMIQ